MTEHSASWNRLGDAVVAAITELDTIDLFASAILKTAQLVVRDNTEELQFGDSMTPVLVYTDAELAVIDNDTLVESIKQIAMAAVETTGNTLWDCQCRNCNQFWQDTAEARAKKLEALLYQDFDGERCPFCGSADIRVSPHASEVERELHPEEA